MSLAQVRWTRYIATVAAVLLATVAAGLARYLLGDVNISLVYLIVVVVVATLWGLRPALLASALAAVALDLFFLDSFGARTVANTDDWLTLLFFLVIAALAGRLASDAQERATEARRREHATAVLYELSTALIAEGDLTVILRDVAQRAAQTFDLDACHILLADEQALVIAAEHGSWDAAGSREAAAMARGILAEGRPAVLYETMSARPADGSLTAREVAGTALYLPLAVGEKRVGLMRVARASDAPFNPEEERLLATFAAQVALVVEKAHLAEHARRAATLEQADRLKSALLSSVSHDLRSPLAAIKTAVTGLLHPGSGLTVQGRAELLEAIDGETDRLTRLVANLLDLSRIESGALHPQKDWVDLAEIIALVVDRLAPRVAQRIAVETSDDVPLVFADYVRMDQVLTNLIENAAAYAPSDSRITVTAHGVRGGVVMRVCDEGPGIAVDERERVFEPFYRGAGAERARVGSGLGLSICRGIVEAHAGSIRVESAGERGACVVVWLPRAAEAHRAAPPSPAEVTA